MPWTLWHKSRILNLASHSVKGFVVFQAHTIQRLVQGRLVTGNGKVTPETVTA